jgi:hypothetical protein
MGWCAARALGLCLLIAGCGDDDSGVADGGGSAGSGGASGSGRAGASGSGRAGASGSAADAGLDASRPPPDDSGVSPPPKDAGRDAQGGDTCSLPAETGRCRAAIPRYYHDSASGTCKQFTYGGCDGNANNFETQQACERACGGSSGGARGCEVEGKTYASGDDGISDPFSCNSCSCDDGGLICTEIACAEPCPDGTAAGTSCARCGPTDACEVQRTGCLPECDDNDDCQGTGSGFCAGGLCKLLCG